MKAVKISVKRSKGCLVIRSNDDIILEVIYKALYEFVNDTNNRFFEGYR